ncbi:MULTISPECIES: ester cyclase [unclassified Lysobacter]|uniref:ester cyclase n=1 Tax=unclassified Lysobacter TaxID=2635362 RepID=UPI001BE55D19|nr:MULTISPECIES: ester cyclase [unclassified Lysobacter]MBT2747893.1 ester cyclase [Lysobacter sp. ISL-42]MBT2753767.1 ester cyclase [Lysobacter sp. ISL-50]MBT2779055.1 ester cyclase [Lysobacter sp. ISL-54]
MSTPPLRAGLLALSLATVFAAGCNRASPDRAPLTAAAADATILKRMQAEQAQQDRNLQTFDELDFVHYSNQQWNDFHKSHAQNILVHYPDGRTTTGLDAHIAELKPQFAFAPDTKIKVHPIKIAQGNLTAVTGVMEGTFSQPMALGDGKTLAPTQKRFKLEMATIGRWEKGVMVEEWLFWDNQAFMKQIGAAQ